MAMKFFHFGTAFTPNPTGTLNGILFVLLFPKTSPISNRVDLSGRKKNMSASREWSVFRVSDLFKDVLGE
jgi:hypothetical protein